MKKNKFSFLFLAVVMLFSVLLVSCGAEAGQYNDAKALYEAGKYDEALTAFEAIGDYEDSKDWVKKCKAAVLDGKYNAALALLNEGKIVEAYEALVALNGHKDSADKAAGIEDQYKNEKLKSAKAGDVVTLGRYEQDNDLDNGADDIEWIVLDVQEGKALLISKCILDYQKITTVTAMREWYEGTFIPTAFNSEELAKILTTELTPDPNKTFSIRLDGTSNEKVFSLNITEVLTYFKTNESRIAEWSAYAKSLSARANTDETVGEWWLRVCKSSNSQRYLVSDNGTIIATYGRIGKGLRPAMWIDLNT